jgi:hypothetical protein
MTETAETIIARALLVVNACGFTLDGEHVFCDDERLKTHTDGYGRPLYYSGECECKSGAPRIIAALDAAGYAVVPKDPLPEIVGSYAEKLAAHSTETPK